MQEVIIAILFISAVVYLGTLLKQNFLLKDADCNKSCGCGLKGKIEKQKKLKMQ